MNEHKAFRVEEVESVAPPPRARVEDAPAGDAPVEHASTKAETPQAAVPASAETAAQKLGRKKDYLEGFLAQKPEPVSATAPGGSLYQSVVDALKDIYDPEIPVNIYDLGLIYSVEVTPDADVAITMTLTTPHCPVAESMPGEVELRAGSVAGVRDAQVNLVWDPPWDPSKMSDEARLELGML